MLVEINALLFLGLLKVNITRSGKHPINPLDLEKNSRLTAWGIIIFIMFYLTHYTWNTGWDQTQWQQQALPFMALLPWWKRFRRHETETKGDKVHAAAAYKNVWMYVGKRTGTEWGIWGNHQPAQDRSEQFSEWWGHPNLCLQQTDCSG